MHTEDYINIPQNTSSGSPRGMKVPDGYFQDFEARVFTKIQEEKANETKVVSLVPEINSNSFFAKIAIAATLVVGLFVLTTRTSNELDSTELAMNVSEEIDYYDFDEYLLAENYSMEDLEDISFTNDYVSSDEIMNYILDENYSEYTIIDNL